MGIGIILLYGYGPMGGPQTSGGLNAKIWDTDGTVSFKGNHKPSIYILFF